MFYSGKNPTQRTKTKLGRLQHISTLYLSDDQNSFTAELMRFNDIYLEFTKQVMNEDDFDVFDLRTVLRNPDKYHASIIIPEVQLKVTEQGAVAYFGKGSQRKETNHQLIRKILTHKD